MKDIARAIFAGMKFDTVAQYEAQVKHASGLIAATIDSPVALAALWRGELEKAEAELDLLHAYVGREMFRSDYRTAGDMRAALDKTRADLAEALAEEKLSSDALALCVKGKRKANDLLRALGRK